MKDDLKLRELKAKDCMIDASKLAEELHGEQEQAGVLENERKLLESKLKEIQVDYYYCDLQSSFLLGCFREKLRTQRMLLQGMEKSKCKSWRKESENWFVK